MFINIPGMVMIEHIKLFLRAKVKGHNVLADGGNRMGVLCCVFVENVFLECRLTAGNGSCPQTVCALFLKLPN